MNTRHVRIILLSLFLLLVLAGCQSSSPGPAADQNVYDGIEVGVTDEGHPYMGSVDAPVTMQEFTDYICPFCSRHVAQVEPLLIEQYIRTGQVRLVFRDHPIASLHPTAHFGHEAALCVAEQGAAMFWAMHDRLFAEAGTWGSLPDPAGYLADLAKELGANMKDYEACLASGRTAALVNATLAEAASYGYSGTPMFRLTRAGSDAASTVRGAQDVSVFQEYIDAMIAGEAPAEEPTPDPESQLPFWLRSEGLASDPDRPGYTLGGDAFKGNPEAAVKVIAFCDFQDASCRRHALEVQPAMDETFVEPGKVLWLFKNLPSRSNAQAAIAAAAAECGGEQEQFWAMHQAIFAGVDQWAVDDPIPGLVAIAGEVGLDAEAFATCLDGRAAMEQVAADLSDALELGAGSPVLGVLHSGGLQGYPMTVSVDELTGILAGFVGDGDGGE